MNLKTITAIAASLVATSAWATTPANQRCGAGTCSKKETSAPKNEASCSKKDASCSKKEAACSKKETGDSSKEAACSKKDSSSAKQ